MFVLRDSHLSAFADAARQSFEERLLADLQTRFPGECARLGEQGVRRRISAGVAASLGEDVRPESVVADRIRASFDSGPLSKPAR
jgi:uncharacterized protein YlxP (DUF503 family)